MGNNRDSLQGGGGIVVLTMWDVEENYPGFPRFITLQPNLPLPDCSYTLGAGRVVGAGCGAEKIDIVGNTHSQHPLQNVAGLSTGKHST